MQNRIIWCLKVHEACTISTHVLLCGKILVHLGLWWASPFWLVSLFASSSTKPLSLYLSLHAWSLRSCLVGIRPSRPTSSTEASLCLYNLQAAVKCPYSGLDCIKEQDRKWIALDALLNSQEIQLPAWIQLIIYNFILVFIECSFTYRCQMPKPAPYLKCLQQDCTQPQRLLQQLPPLDLVASCHASQHSVLQYKEHPRRSGSAAILLQNFMDI